MMRLAVLDDREGVALEFAPWERLSPEIVVDVYHDHIQDENELVDRLLPYDILVIMRERTRFPRSLLERLINLKLLITTGKRNLAVDMKACKEHGILVCGTRSSKTAAAELAWALILGTLRRIPQHDQAMRKGFWGETIGSGLSGKVLGIVGLGKLGAQVARIGQAFGMKVVAWSENLTSQRAAEFGVERVEKSVFFPIADVISIHVVLSERTRGLVGAHEIGQMKPEAYLINTSRGAVVNEEALIDALRSNRIAGAGLDVFETEPLPPGHPLLGLTNIVITPHIGYVTREAFQIYYRDAYEDVIAWLSGRSIRVLSGGSGKTDFGNT